MFQLFAVFGFWWLLVFLKSKKQTNKKRICFLKLTAIFSLPYFPYAFSNTSDTYSHCHIKQYSVYFNVSCMLCESEVALTSVSVAQTVMSNVLRSDCHNTSSVSCMLFETEVTLTAAVVGMYVFR